MSSVRCLMFRSNELFCCENAFHIGSRVRSSKSHRQCGYQGISHKIELGVRASKEIAFRRQFVISIERQFSSISGRSGSLYCLSIWYPFGIHLISISFNKFLFGASSLTWPPNGFRTCYSIASDRPSINTERRERKTIFNKLNWRAFPVRLLPRTQCKLLPDRAKRSKNRATESIAIFDVLDRF